MATAKIRPQVDPRKRRVTRALIRLISGAMRRPMIKFKALMLAALILLGSANISIASTEVEAKEELLNYIRVLFSDKKVIEAYHKLISEGYSWQDEYAKFGSMVDEKGESFYGQVQIVMEKGKGTNRKAAELAGDPGWVVLEKKKSGSEGNAALSAKIRVLVIDFLWSRKGNKIENIKVGTYSP